MADQIVKREESINSFREGRSHSGWRGILQRLCFSIQREERTVGKITHEHQCLSA